MSKKIRVGVFGGGGAGHHHLEAFANMSEEVEIVGVMFFFMFKVPTYETNSPEDYLTEIQIGSATKRWQSAYALSK